MGRISKVLLVKGANLTQGNFATTFPLGLLYLASAARKEFPELEIRIRDLRLPGTTIESTAAEAREFAPDLIGISCITVEAPSLHSMAGALRGLGITAPILAGGPHASSFPEEVLADASIDAIVHAEGERTWVDAIRAFSAGAGLEGMPGVSVRSAGGIAAGPARGYIEDLDAQPFPAWDLVDIDAYAALGSMAPNRKGRYMNLFTSRACPYRCVYCHNMFGKGFRARSPESVMKEIELLHATYGITMFEILDDIFNWDLDRAKRIFDMLHERGLKVELAFPNGLRCDRIDREFLEKLKRLGMAHISVAVESASPRIQRMLRKNLKLDRVTDTINMCDDLGIFSRGFFMLGFPTETEEEMRRTVDYACRSRLHSALFFTVIPFKGTELYEMCRERLREMQVDYSDFDYFTSPINVSAVADSVLFRIQKRALLRFFLSPWRIYRLLRLFPHKSILFRKALPALVYRFLRSGKGNRNGSVPRSACSTAQR